MDCFNENNTNTHHVDINNINLLCTSGPIMAGTKAVTPAKTVRTTTKSIIGLYSKELCGSGKFLSLASSACRNAITVTKFVTVNNDSADPCNQSESANETPYNSCAAIAAGMDRNTNKRHVANLQ